MADPLPPETDLSLLMADVGHTFENSNLLRNAVTHSSLIGDDSRHTESNERQEFLGDRVLGLVVAEMLLGRFPTENEGDISRRHAALVRMETLARVATEIHLGRYIHMSRGEERSGGRKSASLLADACEAVISALYQDGGLEAARGFIESRWSPLISEDLTPPKDAKTTLQEWAQGDGKPLPEYKETGREGPDHDPIFTVEVRVKGFDPVSGMGGSKRLAEQDAASRMLKQAGIGNG